MEKQKIVFLILHYNVIAETIKSIETIKNHIEQCEYEIVVVDNHSLNGTGIQLKEKYENDKKIHVILNDKNLGFARGNNVGFKFAKYELKADYIVMMNNDTYITQSNFCELVKKEFDKSNFAVLGPKIILPDNKINYRAPYLKSIKEQKKRILKLQIKNILWKIHIYPILKKTKTILKRNKKENNKRKVYDRYDRMENIILHRMFFGFFIKIH